MAWADAGHSRGQEARQETPFVPGLAAWLEIARKSPKARVAK
jgi:hypothetical protein